MLAFLFGLVFWSNYNTTIWVIIKKSTGNIFIITFIQANYLKEQKQ
jgi:hypothetical protein